MTSKQALGLTMNELAEVNAEHVTTISKLEQKLTDMAVQLANAESKCRELAVDNASLKNPENWLLQSDYGYEASEVATQNGATEDESLRSGMVAIINRIEAPATDAFLAEVRASARNDFIGRIEWIIRNECNPDKTEAIINELQNFSDELKLEAAQ